MSRIVIVEDEKKIARFLELELRHEGYEVACAGDGRTGLEEALSPVGLYGQIPQVRLPPGRPAARALGGFNSFFG